MAVFLILKIWSSEVFLFLLDNKLSCNLFLMYMNGFLLHMQALVQAGAELLPSQVSCIGKANKLGGFLAAYFTTADYIL